MAEPVNDTARAVRLVLGIARLGENDLCGWWNGHAIDRTGRYVLSGMFRRTWRPAALELDVAAATRMHGQLLGRLTALHLFSDRLPFRRWAVGWLAEQKTVTKAHQLLEVLENWTLKEAVESIRTWTAGAALSRAEPLGEGLLLGRITGADIDDPTKLGEIAQRLAASYTAEAGPLRPPYFDLAAKQ